MATTIYVMESVNLFCGDDDPTNSKFLTLETLQLPELQETFIDHMPGGAIAGVELGMGVIQKLSATFKLRGFDMSMLQQFGLGSQAKKRYTAYGAVRDKRTGSLIEAKAILEARLGRIAPDSFTRGDALGHEYALNEIMHYEFHMNRAEELYWDFWTNTLRIGGVAQNDDVNRILRING